MGLYEELLAEQERRGIAPIEPAQGPAPIEPAQGPAPTGPVQGLKAPVDPLYEELLAEQERRGIAPVEPEPANVVQGLKMPEPVEIDTAAPTPAVKLRRYSNPDTIADLQATPIDHRTPWEKRDKTEDSTMAKIMDPLMRRNEYQVKNASELPEDKQQKQLDYLFRDTRPTRYGEDGAPDQTPFIQRAQGHGYTGEQIKSFLDTSDRAARSTVPTGKGFLGSLAEVGRGAAIGLGEGFGDVAKAGQWFTPSIDAEHEKALESAASSIKGYMDKNPQVFAESQKNKDRPWYSPIKALAGGTRMIGRMAPGMLIPGGVAVQFWGSMAQEKYDQLAEEKPDMPEAEKIAWATAEGVVQGGVEWLQSKIPIGALKKFLPASAKNDVLKQAAGLSKTSKGGILGSILGTYAAELSLETGQDTASRQLDYYSELEAEGVSVDDILESLKQNAGPVLVTTGLLATPGKVSEVKQRKKIGETLMAGAEDVTPQERVAAVNALHTLVAEQDKPLADRWRRSAMPVALNNQPLVIPTDEKFTAPKTEAQKAREKVLQGMRGGSVTGQELVALRESPDQLARYGLTQKDIDGVIQTQEYSRQEIADFQVALDAAPNDAVRQGILASARGQVITKMDGVLNAQEEQQAGQAEETTEEADQGRPQVTEQEFSAQIERDKLELSGRDNLTADEQVFLDTIQEYDGRPRELAAVMDIDIVEQPTRQGRIQELELKRDGWEDQGIPQQKLTVDENAELELLMAEEQANQAALVAEELAKDDTIALEPGEAAAQVEQAATMVEQQATEQQATEQQATEQQATEQQATEQQATKPPTPLMQKNLENLQLQEREIQRLEDDLAALPSWKTQRIGKVEAYKRTQEDDYLASAERQPLEFRSDESLRREQALLIERLQENPDSEELINRAAEVTSVLLERSKASKKAKKPTKGLTKDEAISELKSEFGDQRVQGLIDDGTLNIIDKEETAPTGAKLSVKDIIALEGPDKPVLQKFAQVFQNRIKQKDRTREDVDRIGKDALRDIFENPEEYVALPGKGDLSADTFLRMSDGTMYDPTNDTHVLEASDETKRVHELKQNNPGELRKALDQEAEQIALQRVEDIQDLIEYLVDNDAYTTAEAALIVNAAAKWAARYDKASGKVVLIKITKKNRHRVTVTDSSIAPAVAEHMRMDKPFKKAFEDGVKAGIDRSMAENKNKGLDGWKKFEQSDSMEDAAELNEACAGSTWCTYTGGVSTAASQLKDGDFYVFYKDGKPEIAIRTENGKLVETRGNTDNQRLEEWHYAESEKFLKGNKDVTGTEVFFNAVEAKKAIKKALDTGKWDNKLSRFVHVDNSGEFFIEIDLSTTGYGEDTVSKSISDKLLVILNNKYTSVASFINGTKYLPTGTNLDNLPQSTLDTITSTGDIAINGTVSLPNLETARFISVHGSLNAPKLRSIYMLDIFKDGSIKAPMLQTVEHYLSVTNGAFKFESLTSVDIIGVYNNTTLYLPSLTAVHSELMIGEGSTVYVNSLKRAGSVRIGSQANLYAESLEKLGWLYCDEKAELPNLREATSLRLSESVTLKVPKLNSVKDITINNHAKLKAPELQKVHYKIEVFGHGTIEAPKLEEVAVIRKDGDSTIIAPNLKKKSQAGWYSPASGTMTIVAENLEPGEAADILRHEALHRSLSEDEEFVAKKTELLSQFEALRDKGNKKVLAAFDSVPKDTVPQDIVEEAWAYYVQQNPKANLVRRVIAAIKAVLKRLGIPTTGMTEADFQRLAARGLEKQLAATEGQQSNSLEAKVLKELGIKALPKHIKVVQSEDEIPKEALTGTGLASMTEPKWTSRLVNDYISKGPNKASSEEWIKIIKRWKNVPKGVQDEVEFSSLVEWLETNEKNKISKVDIANYLELSGLRLTDEIRDIGAPNEEANDLLNSMREVIKKIAPGITLTQLDIILSDYVEKDTYINEEFNRLDVKGPINLNGELLTELYNSRDLYHSVMIDEDLGFSFMVLAGPSENYTEILLGVPKSTITRYKATREGDWASKSFDTLKEAEDFVERISGKFTIEPFEQIDHSKLFTTGHFGRNNFLHLRVDTRGNILFINELQSDWSQQLKSGQEGIPAVPLTNAWELLAIKRAIMHAIINGQDTIALPSTIEQVVEIEQWGTIATDKTPGNVFQTTDGRWLVIQDIGVASNPQLMQEVLDGGGYEYVADVTPIIERYTTRLPKALNKWLKKYKAKLAPITLKGDRRAKKINYPEQYEVQGFKITDELKEAAINGLPMAAKQERKLAGLYHKGNIYLVADNIDPEYDIKKLLVHEGGHWLRRNDKAYQKRYAALLAQMQNIAQESRSVKEREALRAAREKAILNTINPTEDRLDEETLMYFLQEEANQELSLYKKIVSLIKQFIFKHFGISPAKLNMSGYDMAQIIARDIRKSVRENTIQAFQSERAMAVFLGPGADKADLNTQFQAVMAIRFGEKPEKVWNDLGWFKGDDGQWRFEVDDTKMTFKQDPRNLQYRSVPPGISSKDARKGGVRLGDLIDHKELFDNYDKLAEIMVFNEPGSTGGSYYPEHNIITITTGPGSYTVQETLIHEIQHAVQYMEGTSSGGDLKHTKEYLDVATPEVIEALRAELVQEQINKLQYANENIAAGSNRDSLVADIEGTIEALQSTNTTQAALKDILAKHMKFQVYSRLYGEVEASTTENRVSMTAEERRAWYPEGSKGPYIHVPAEQNLGPYFSISEDSQPLEASKFDAGAKLDELFADVQAEVKPEHMANDTREAYDIGSKSRDKKVKEVADLHKRLDPYGISFMRDEDTQTVSWADRLLSSPEYSFMKDEAASRVLSAASNMDEIKYQMQNDILAGFDTIIRLMKKDTPKDYKIAQDYLIKVDQTGEGFRARGNDVIGIDGEVISSHDTREEMSEALIEVEQDYLRNDLGFTNEAAAIVQLYRELMARSLAAQMQNIVDQIEVATRYNIPEPKVQLPGRKSITLSEALNMMGDLEGIYFPRVRKDEKYFVRLEKDGEPDVLITVGHYIPENLKRKPFNNKTRRAINRLVKTFSKAGKEIKKYEEQGYTSLGIELSNDPAREAINVPGLIASIDSILGMAEEVSSKEELAAAVKINDILSVRIADILKTTGPLKNRKQRAEHLTLGYETDLATAALAHAQQIAAILSKQQIARDMVSALTGRDVSFEEFEAANPEATRKDYLAFVSRRKVDPVAQKDLYSDLRTYIQYVLEPARGYSKAIGYLKSLAVFKYLGFRLASPAVNLTNMVMAVPATIGAHTGVSINKAYRLVEEAARKYASHRSEQLIARGFSDTLIDRARVMAETAAKEVGKTITLHKKNSEEDNWVFEQITNRGWDQAHFNIDATRELQDTTGKLWNSAVAASMYMFGATEKANRAMTIFAAYKAHMLANPNMSKEEALTKAKHTSNRAHGEYGKATKPWIVQKNPWLDLAYTFTKFQHNYLLNMIEMGIKYKSWKSVLLMTAAPGILAGTNAVVGMPIFMAVAGVALKALGMGGDDPEEEYFAWLEKFLPEWVEKIARHGLIGALGINFQGSLAMRLPLQSLSLVELGGAPVATLQDAFEAGRHLYYGEQLKALEKALPSGAGGSMVKAYRLRTEGYTSKQYAPRFFGAEQMRPTPMETALIALTFNPTRTAKAQSIIWSERQVKQSFTKKRSKIMRRLRKFYGPGGGDPVDLAKASELIDEYNSAVQAANPRYRLTYLTPAKINKTLAQSMKPSRAERERIE